MTKRYHERVKLGAVANNLVSYGSMTVILIAVATKNNADAIANSEWWSEYSDTALISAVKQFYPIFIALSGGLLLFGALRAAGRPAPIFRCAVMIILMYLYIITRSLVPAPENAIKFLLSALLAFGISFNLSYSWLNENLDESIRKIFNVLLLSSGWIIFANLLNYMTGHGMVPGASRLIGIAGHPNFTGVHIAIGIPLFLVVILGRGLLNLAFAVPTAVAGVYLLTLTGSRTALLALAIGVSVATAIVLRIRPLICLLGLVGIALAAALALHVLGASGKFSVSESNAFYREENTRAETFTYLLEQVATRPMLGLGYFEGLPENSILRGWAAFGIVVPVFLFIITVITVQRYRMLLALNVERSRLAGLVGCISAILAGSITEGYLVDAFSYAMVCFIIIAIFSDRINLVRRRAGQKRNDDAPIGERGSHEGAIGRTLERALR